MSTAAARKIDQEFSLEIISDSTTVVDLILVMTLKIDDIVSG
jgi:hypothetical protein